MAEVKRSSFEANRTRSAPQADARFTRPEPVDILAVVRARSLLAAAIWAAVVVASACSFDFARYRYAGGSGGAGGAGTGATGPGGAGGGGGVPTGPGSVEWALQLGGADNDIAIAVDVAPDGTVVVVGSFAGAMAVDTQTTLVAQGVRDLFVVKVSAAGQPIWARAYPGDRETFVRDVAVDGSGNIIVVGGFDGTANFGGGMRGSGDANATDLFIVKYSANGDWIWDLVAGAPATNEQLNGVDVAGSDIAVAGSFDGTLTLGGFMLLAPGTATDVIYARLAADGSVTHASRYGDAMSNVGSAIAFISSGAMPGSDVVLTADIGTSIDFGGGVLAGNGPTSAAVAQLGPMGEHRFSDVYASSGGDQIMAAAVDRNGPIWLTGLGQGDIDFGGGLLTGLGGEDIYVVKLNDNGTHAYSSLFGDGMRQHGRDVAVDTSRNVVVVGALEGGADFGGGALTSGGLNDVFVAKLSLDGAHVLSRAFGGDGADRALGVAVDSSGIYVVGVMSSTVVFDATTLLSRGAQDGFLIKLRP